MSNIRKAGATGRKVADNVKIPPENLSSALNDPEIGEDVKQLLSARGVSPEVAARAGDVSIWSKTYTESHSNALMDGAGNILFESNLPLTEADKKIIDRLGTRTKEHIL
jgi:hypothetical protein